MIVFIIWKLEWLKILFKLTSKREVATALLECKCFDYYFQVLFVNITVWILFEYSVLPALISPTCIDLMLTNKLRSFQIKCVIETGLSDFRKMTISVLKMRFRKLPPKVINYRVFKKFDNERFMNIYISLRTYWL